MGYKCIVPGCHRTNKEIMLHSFPRDPEMFKLWVKAIGPCDIQISRRKISRICDIHFSSEMKYSNNRNRTNLKARAIPTLYLPGCTVVQPLIQDEVLNPVPGCSNAQEMDSTIKDLSVQRETAMTTVTPQRIPRKRRDLNTRINLLRCGNETRKVNLTPKAKKFYNIARNMISISRRLNNENSTLRRRLFEAKKFVNSSEFFLEKVNKTTFNFINSQLEMQSRKSKGRRYTIDDKILALSLLKQSPKGYRLLKKIFALPSRKTLMMLLHNIPFNVGINQTILNALKLSVAKMNPEDRYCCLMFDEMSIEPSLTYNSKTDKIEGFEDYGDGRKLKFADHAMVFMVRGIRKKWKQPIAYFFSENGMSAPNIVKNLKCIISALHNIDLTVVATVCDQLSINCTAIKMLYEETNRKYVKQQTENRIFGFEVDNLEVVPLYDGPHLIKGLRNNLLEYDIKFQWKCEEQIASWKDIVTLYDVDEGDYDTRMLNKLTDAHIVKDKIKKMKVKLATQVFSHRVSSTMRGLVKHGNCLPNSAVDTADFLLFGDKLFDSVNSSTLYSVEGKPLRGAITETSAHITFWEEAIKVLSSMKIIKPGGQSSVPPTIKNWISTLRGMKYIWNQMKKKGFKFLLGRNFNQDPIENFFSCIRSQGVRNINPTTAAFTNAFKTLVVNNFTSAHSLGANCELDESEGVISSLREFITSNSTSQGIEEQQEKEDEKCPEIIPETGEWSNVVRQHQSYMAGYFSKKIIKSVRGCKICIFQLLSDQEGEDHQLISIRNYRAKKLLQPNTIFTEFYEKCSAIVHFYLPKLSLQNNIRNKIIELVKKNISKNFSCKKHNLKEIFIKKFVTFYIFTWINNINKIVKGVDSRKINDNVKRLALEKGRKWKKKKEIIKNLKK